MLLDLCKILKLLFSLQFSTVSTPTGDYTILWIFTEEQYGPGGGVAEAAGVCVRHLGEGEPGPLPGRGVISTAIERSGSIPLTNGSGSRRPKNIRIWRIRIRNTGGKPTWCQDRLRRTGEEEGMEGGIVAPDVVCVLFQVFRNVSPSFDLGCHHSCAIIDIFV